jgi:tRNA U34 5-carboxymethylaminomethyl modifying GTPase MnmE/TrmE
LSKEDPDLEEMFKKIEKKLDISDKDGDGFASKRDLDLLETFVSDLKDVLNDLKNKVTVDVLEIKLIEATHALDEMLGVENTMEDVYQTVFANFCVGK